MSGHHAATVRRTPRRSSWGGRITAFGLVIAISLAGTITASVAWAFWSAGSLPGGSTTSTAATVAAGNTPAVAASPTSVAVSWAASTLSTGTAVSGYIVHRYDSTGTVLQTTGAGCSGLITAIVFGGATGSTGSIITATLLAAGNNIFASVFSVQFFQEIADKLISVLVVYIVIKGLPTRYLSKVKFGYLYTGREKKTRVRTTTVD